MACLSTISRSTDGRSGFYLYLIKSFANTSARWAAAGAWTKPISRSRAPGNTSTARWTRKARRSIFYYQWSRRNTYHRAASEVSQQHRGAEPSGHQAGHRTNAQLQVISSCQKCPSRHRTHAHDPRRSAHDQGLYRAVLCRLVLCVGRKNPSRLRNWHPFLPQTRLSTGNATEPRIQTSFLVCLALIYRLSWKIHVNESTD